MATYVLVLVLVLRLVLAVPLVHLESSFQTTTSRLPLHSNRRITHVLQLMNKNIGILKHKSICKSLTPSMPFEGGPGVGARPSLIAFRIIAALYLQYFRFSLICWSHTHTLSHARS